MNDFYDVDGNPIEIGDHCEPVGEGRRVLIVEQTYVKEYNNTVLIGQQVEDPEAYSYLTHENLATNFRRVR